MTKEEKMQQMRISKDPSYALSMATLRMMESTHAIKGIPGPVGPKPIKYVDYFTPNDINEIIARVREQVKDGKNSVVPGPRGASGFRGEKGKDGMSPDVELIVRQVLSRIKMPKDGVSPKIEDIVKQVQDGIKSTPIDADLVTKTELINFLKRGGFRGGGLSSVATDSTLTGNGTAASPLHVVGSSGTWFQDEVPSGTKNGLNVTFTLAHTPASVVFLYVNGQYQVSGGANYTRSGTTITMTAGNAPLSSDTLIATYS